MPIFIAYAIARRFNANPVLAAVVTAVLLNPQFIEVMNEAKTTERDVPGYSCDVSAVRFNHHTRYPDCLDRCLYRKNC